MLLKGENLTPLPWRLVLGRARQDPRFGKTDVQIQSNSYAVRVSWGFEDGLVAPGPLIPPKLCSASNLGNEQEQASVACADGLSLSWRGRMVRLRPPWSPRGQRSPVNERERGAPLAIGGQVVQMVGHRCSLPKINRMAVEDVESWGTSKLGGEC
jgi:hypothetical protein